MVVWCCCCDVAFGVEGVVVVVAFGVEGVVVVAFGVEGVVVVPISMGVDDGPGVVVVVVVASSAMGVVDGVVVGVSSSAMGVVDGVVVGVSSSAMGVVDGVGVVSVCADAVGVTSVCADVVGMTSVGADDGGCSSWLIDERAATSLYRSNCTTGRRCRLPMLRCALWLLLLPVVAHVACKVWLSPTILLIFHGPDDLVCMPLCSCSVFHTSCPTLYLCGECCLLCRRRRSRVAAREVFAACCRIHSISF